MKKTSCSGPLYAHLGHFAKQKYLDKGHNDCPSGQDCDASDSDPKKYVPAGPEETAKRAQQATNGFMKAANDNPVSKAIKWIAGD